MFQLDTELDWLVGVPVPTPSTRPVLLLDHPFTTNTDPILLLEVHQ